jgi:hypothetical protein
MAGSHDPLRYHRTRLGGSAVAKQLGPPDRENLDFHIYPVE